MIVKFQVAFEQLKLVRQNDGNAVVHFLHRMKCPRTSSSGVNPYLDSCCCSLNRMKDIYQAQHGSVFSQTLGFEVSGPPEKVGSFL